MRQIKTAMMREKIVPVVNENFSFERKLEDCFRSKDLRRDCDGRGKLFIFLFRLKEKFIPHTGKFHFRRETLKRIENKRRGFRRKLCNFIIAVPQTTRR